MPPSKSSDQLLLERFTGSEFGPHPTLPALEVHIFDGAVWWRIMFVEELRQLFFHGDVRELNLGSPTMEIAVDYAELEVQALTNGSEVLKITPQPHDRDGSPLWFAKTAEGRIMPAYFLNPLF